MKTVMTPRPCSTCGLDLRGFQVEYHTERNHSRRPTYEELLLETRELNAPTGRSAEIAEEAASRIARGAESLAAASSATRTKDSLLWRERGKTEIREGVKLLVRAIGLVRLQRIVDQREMIRAEYVVEAESEQDARDNYSRDEDGRQIENVDWEVERVEPNE